MKKEIHIQQAIDDLATIKRAIEKAESGSEKRKRTIGSSFTTHFFIQVFVSIICLMLLLTELLGDFIHTRIFLASAQNQELMEYGLISTGATLISGILFLYALVIASAQKANEDYNVFIAKNFSYLKNLSFSSDLLVKYIVFTIVILAKQPQWIAPLFFLFTADYLFQGRFFQLPIKISLTAGALCIAGMLAQALMHSPTIAWPIATFALLSATSAFYIRKENSKNEC